ncbi:MAG: HEAT repeat domain-containing protein [Saccharofermentanales bacterium]
MGLLAYIILALCFTAIAAEFVGLYILSAKGEAAVNRLRLAAEIINEKLENVISSPTAASMAEEVEDLKEYVGQDKYRMNTMCERIMDLIRMNGDAKAENFQKAVFLIIKAADPARFYRAMLSGKDIYDKAYACRKIADFCVTDQIGTIRSMLSIKNSNLYYNASLALSELGDEEGVYLAISGIRDSVRFSHRVIVEILDRYAGDMIRLGRRLLEVENEYIKASTVKALVKHRIVDFEKIYLSLLEDENINIKIAAIKALGEIGRQDYEKALIAASRNKDWAVRSAAVRAMVKLRSPDVMKAVADATRDKEWWVRYNAAQTLTEIDDDFTYIENVLEGYDKYASEAVIHALYQKSCRSNA